MNPKSVPFDGAQDVLREPQHERSESHWIQNHKTFSVRPSFGGVSKGCLGEDRQSPATEGAGAVLRLLVRNHPGVMSHVCGLFARRGFNVEGILCVPIADGMRSVILLVVNEDERLEQVIRQLRKLEDVLDIRRAPEAREVFASVAGRLC